MFQLTVVNRPGFYYVCFPSVEFNQLVRQNWRSVATRWHQIITGNHVTCVILNFCQVFEPSQISIQPHLQVNSCQERSLFGDGL